MTRSPRRPVFAVSLVLSAMLLAGAAHAAVSNEEILQDPKTRSRS